MPRLHRIVVVLVVVVASLLSVCYGDCSTSFVTETGMAYRTMRTSTGDRPLPVVVSNNQLDPPLSALLAFSSGNKARIMDPDTLSSTASLNSDDLFNRPAGVFIMPSYLRSSVVYNDVLVFVDQNDLIGCLINGGTLDCVRDVNNLASNMIGVVAMPAINAVLLMAQSRYQLVDLNDAPTWNIGSAISLPGGGSNFPNLDNEWRQFLTLVGDSTVVAAGDGQLLTIVVGRQGGTGALVVTSSSWTTAGCCYFMGIVYNPINHVIHLLDDVGLLFTVRADTYETISITFTTGEQWAVGLYLDNDYSQLYAVAQPYSEDTVRVKRFDVRTTTAVYVDQYYDVACPMTWVWQSVVFGDTLYVSDRSMETIMSLYTHQCSVYQACDSCSSDPYCAWCLSSGSCVEQSDIASCVAPLADDGTCPIVTSLSPFTRSIDSSTTITVVGSNFVSPPGFDIVCVVGGLAVESRLLNDRTLECDIEPSPPNTQATAVYAFDDVVLSLTASSGNDTQAFPFGEPLVLATYNCSVTATSCQLCLESALYRSACAWVLLPEGSSLSSPSYPFACVDSGQVPANAILFDVCPVALSNTPNKGLSEGGSEIEVSFTAVPYVAGQPLVNLDYLCVFTPVSPSGPSVNVSGLAVSPTTVRCLSPPGTVGSSTTLTVLYRGMDFTADTPSEDHVWTYETWATTDTTENPYRISTTTTTAFPPEYAPYGLNVNFATRLSAWVAFATTQSNTFCLTAADKATVTVDGTRVDVGTGGDCSIPTCASIQVNGGTNVRHNIVIDYVQTTGSSCLTFTLNGSPVSTANLYISDAQVSAALTFDYTVCSIYTSCSECTDDVSDCFWCSETQTCGNSSIYAECDVVSSTCPRVSAIAPVAVQAGAVGSLTVSGTGLSAAPTLACLYLGENMAGWTAVESGGGSSDDEVAVSCALPSFVNASGGGEERWTNNQLLSWSRAERSAYAVVALQGEYNVSLVVLNSTVSGQGEATVLAPPGGWDTFTTAADLRSALGVQADFSLTTATLSVFDCGLATYSNCSACSVDPVFAGSCAWCPNTFSCTSLEGCAAAGPAEVLSECPVLALLSPPSPTAGSVGGGTVVTLTFNVLPTGAGVDDSSFSCHFGGVEVAATLISPTALTCVSPPAGGGGGGSGGEVDLTVSFRGGPLVTGSGAGSPASPLTFNYYDCSANAVTCTQCSDLSAAAGSSPSALFAECAWCLAEGVCKGSGETCNGNSGSGAFWFGPFPVPPTGAGQLCPSAVRVSGSIRGEVSGGSSFTVEIEPYLPPASDVSGSEDSGYTCSFGSPVSLTVPASVVVTGTTSGLSCTSPPVPSLVSEPSTTVQVLVLLNGALFLEDSLAFEYFSCEAYNCLQCVFNEGDSCEWCSGNRTCANAATASCADPNGWASECTGEDITTSEESDGQGIIDDEDDDDKKSGRGGIIAAVLIVLFLVIILVALLVAHEYSLKKKARERFNPPKLTPAIYKEIVFANVPVNLSRLTVLLSAPLLRLLQKDAARKDHPWLIMNAIFNTVDPADGDKVAQAWVHAAESVGLAEDLICARITHEMAACVEVNTLFRTNSMATKAFRTFSKIKGLTYLHNTLGYVINEALATGNVEVDEGKLANADARTLNRWTLMVATQKITNAIFSSVNEIPPEIRRILRHVQDEFKGRFGQVENYLNASLVTSVRENIKSSLSLYQDTRTDLSLLQSSQAVTMRPLLSKLEDKLGDLEDEMKSLRTNMIKLVAAKDPSSEAAVALAKESEKANNSIAVGGFFFLRFVVPAITAPESYGMVRLVPEQDDRRVLILVSKVVQNLSNCKMFGSKEGYMLKMNPWIQDNLDRVHNFFTEIASYEGSERTETEVPSSIVDSALVAMHKQISDNMPEICNFIVDGGKGGLAKPFEETALDDLGNALEEGAFSAQSEADKGETSRDSLVSFRSSLREFRGVARSRSHTQEASLPPLPKLPPTPGGDEGAGARPTRAATDAQSPLPPLPGPPRPHSSSNAPNPSQFSSVGGGSAGVGRTADGGTNSGGGSGGGMSSPLAGPPKPGASSSGQGAQFPSYSANGGMSSPLAGPPKPGASSGGQGAQFPSYSANGGMSSPLAGPPRPGSSSGGGGGQGAQFPSYSANGGMSSPLAGPPRPGSSSGGGGGQGAQFPSYSANGGMSSPLAGPPKPGASSGAQFPSYVGSVSGKDGDMSEFFPSTYVSKTGVAIVSTPDDSPVTPSFTGARPLSTLPPPPPPGSIGRPLSTLPPPPPKKESGSSSPREDGGGSNSPRASTRLSVSSGGGNAPTAAGGSSPPS